MQPVQRSWWSLVGFKDLGVGPREGSRKVLILFGLKPPLAGDSKGKGGFYG